VLGRREAQRNAHEPFSFLRLSTGQSLLTAKPDAAVPLAGDWEWVPTPGPASNLSEEARRAWLGAALVGLGLVGRTRKA
jgi:hypothetical protein